MKKNNYIFITFFLVITIIIVYSPSRNKIRQFGYNLFDRPMKSLNLKGSRLAKFIISFKKVSDLQKENTELASKIIQLEVDRSKIAELEHENALLKQEIGFAEKNNTTTLLPATIIGREPTSFLDYIIIDKGAEDGLTEGMGAVSGGALIGQVSQVFPHQSKVILITSKDSIVLAMLENSRSKGVLRGGISGLVLENISQDVPFESGENIVTSGLDGQLKAGILIGKTTNVESSSSDLFKNLAVEPVADLSRLELVFVIKN